MLKGDLFNLLKRIIYESWSPIPDSYKEDICNIINRGIAEEDNLYGTKIGLNGYFTPDSFDDLRDNLSLDTATLCTVEPGIDRVIGSCFMNPSPENAWPNNLDWFDDEDDPVYLSSFGILKDFRNQGMGTGFLDWLMGEYSKRGFGSCVLRVDDENTGARKLYERNGFIIKKSYVDPNDGVLKNIMVMRFSK